MVALLAVAGIMATMAYSTVEVRSPASGTAVATNVALLALDCNPGLGRNDDTCDVKSDGRLHLDFAAGLEVGGTPGTDPIPGNPQTTIVSADGEHKSTTGGNKKYFVRVTVTDSKGDTETFDTPKYNRGTKNFKVTSGLNTRCIEYEYEADDNKNGPPKYEKYTGTHCLPEDATPDVPGTPGTPGNSRYGFQPGSTYTFVDLVRITNNSSDGVNVSVEMDLELDDIDMDVTDSGGNDLTSGTRYLAPGDSMLVSFSFTVPDEWGVPDKFPTLAEQYPFAGMMVVNAVATAAP